MAHMKMAVLSYSTLLVIWTIWHYTSGWYSNTTRHAVPGTTGPKQPNWTCHKSGKCSGKAPSLSISSQTLSWLKCGPNFNLYPGSCPSLNIMIVSVNLVFNILLQHTWCHHALFNCMLFLVFQISIYVHSFPLPTENKHRTFLHIKLLSIYMSESHFDQETRALCGKIMQFSWNLRMCVCMYTHPQR